MPTERLTITSPAGTELAGSLELPTGLVRGAALFAHCFTCTRKSRAAVHVARALAAEGRPSRKMAAHIAFLQLVKAADVIHALSAQRT